MNSADLVLINADVYTGDPENAWAEAIAVAGGKLVSVGTAAEISTLVGPDTEVIDAGGRMVMPGLCDVHTHLGYGGTQAAWELSLSPTATLEDILDQVRSHAAALGPDEWITGGNIASTVLADLASTRHLEALDEAAGGRPVILRDDSMHNRWVSCQRPCSSPQRRPVVLPTDGQWKFPGGGQIYP
ncbi:amidohydrolase family protein, partial [Streptomyces sp. NPDC055815]